MLTLWATRNGIAVGNGPIFTALSGQIMMTELGQFNKHSIVLPASDERAVLAMKEYTFLEIQQDGLGTIQYGYVTNPRQQITDRDEHTITLELEPLTVECTWRRTGRGWIAQNLLSVIAARLGALVPGWTGLLVADANTPAPMPGFIQGDLTVSVTLNGSPLAAFLDTAKQFSQFARLGVDANGAPTRRLEMGQFGAAPTMWLQDPKGGDPDLMVNNNLIRLIATVDREPNTVTNLVNVTVPFGGGNSSDSLVTLERLWRIVNDPTYINYGRYGTNNESVTRTGLPSLFTEYDGVNYPISDPLNPPTGAIQWYTTLPGTTAPVPLPAGHTVVVGTRGANGIVPLTEYDGNGHIVVGAVPVVQQGAIGTRALRLDGHWDYYVYDRASYTTYGHKEGDFTDSGLTYADSSVGNQEYTERALYIEMTTQFRRYAHPHHTFSCTAPGLGRPTLAGELIAVDFQRTSVNDRGAVVEMDVTDNLRVMSVVRTFAPVSGGVDPPPVDTYITSNLGRFEDDDSSFAAQQAATIVALQINQGTSFAPMTVNDRSNVDAKHPLVTHVSVPKQLFRWQRCNLRVDFQPYTATATTAENAPGQDIDISVGDQDVELPLPSDLNLDGTFNDAGTGATGTTDGFAADLYVRAWAVSGAKGPTVGAGFFPESANKGGFSVATGNSLNIPIYRDTSGQSAGLDKKTTASAFTAPIKKLVAKAQSVIAHIPAGKALAKLPQHTHPLDQEIPDGPLPVSCLVDINGSSLSSGLVLLSGTRALDGSFTSSFEVDDVSDLLNAINGDFDVTLHAGTSAGNLFGVGAFQLSMTLFAEFGGLAATFRAA